MPGLSITFFGGLYIRRANEAEGFSLPRCLASLFAYLLREPGRTYKREVLIGEFWGELPERDARRCLRSALCRLRRILEAGVPKGTYLRCSQHGEISFNERSDFSLDVAEFTAKTAVLSRSVDHSLSDVEAAQLQEAVTMYVGELLPGMYEDWVIVEREQLRSLYIDGLIELVWQHINGGRRETALAYGAKVLAEDPLRESMHQTIMRLYLQDGRRSDAVVQYRRLERLLADELGIAPMPETSTLFHSAIGDLPLDGFEATASSTHTNMRTEKLESGASELMNAADHIVTALREIDTARERLKLSLARMGKLTDA